MPQLLELPVESIQLTRDRFREDIGDIDELAISILKHGQMEPIIVDENDELIAGFRRLSAAKLNGAQTILAIRRQDVSELQAREMELEENLIRKQMTWLEHQKAIVELDRLKQANNPGWSQTQTAIAAGLPRQADVSEAYKLVEMTKMFPEIANAKSKNQALSWAQSKASNIMRMHEVRNTPEDFASIEERIALGDSVEYIKTVPDNSCRLILTDPPFGINLEQRTNGTEGTITSYVDDVKSYERLLSMAPDLYRVLKTDGFLIWFFGPSWYERCKHVFQSVGFLVDEMPIVWDRSDGRSFTTRPDRYFARAYDMALHCIKGDPQIVVRGKPNVLRIPPVDNSEREALVERPVELYAELIQRLTVPGETVADFFVGSGSCPAAAAKTRRNYFGCELNPERRAIAVKKIRANTPD